MNLSYQPLFYRLENKSDEQLFKQLLKDEQVIIRDEIYNQLKEYLKCTNPSKILIDQDYLSLITNHLNGKDIYKYGVWVYYSWSKELLHILDKDEFITVRTNRNQYKITKPEQETLDKKIVGIAGLSVGHSVALTMATERICGELRLADFDLIELSNLNRLRTGIRNLGLKKVIVAAREISEIDPFINVKIYDEGLNSNNMNDFFTKDGNIDVYVEVCDSLDIKLESRYKARELKICVLMDTNDRGMLDIERFDLDPTREILHGLLDDYTINKLITPQEKLNLIYKILDIDKISLKLKMSISEIGKSINAWPQLASSTTLGGALTTDIARKILLKQHNKSGRYYIDFDELIPG